MEIVDTHAHFIPGSVMDLIRAGDWLDGLTIEMRQGTPWMVHRQGYAYPVEAPFCDVQARLAHMDRCGIDRAVLSVPPTFFFYWNAADDAVDAARRLNDGLAAAVAAGGGRLTAMATVPMQDPDAAVTELRRAAAAGMRGVQIGPNVEDSVLDGTDHERVLAVAAECGMPVVLHPYYVGSRTGLSDFYLTNLLGNPWQTTVAAARLVLSGALDRLPELDVVLVHGGGYLPAAIGRLDHGSRVRSELDHLAAPPSGYLRRFHYDTLTHDPAGLAHLIDRVGPDRVVFGSDTPYDMGDESFDSQLGGLSLPDGHRALIAHGNAERLFELENREGS